MPDIYLVGAAVSYQPIEALDWGLGLPKCFPLSLFSVGLPILLANTSLQEGGAAFRRPALFAV